MRQQDYLSLARQSTKKLWDAYLELKKMQEEWNALDYGNTLANGEGANEGYTKAEVGSVVFDTINAMETLMGQGHATNIAKLL